jgi:hypothetical protein
MNECKMPLINPLTPELNPSAQRYLTRFYWDIIAFRRNVLPPYLELESKSRDGGVLPYNEGINLFLVGVTLVYLGRQYLGAVYLKGLRSADIISVSVACVYLTFVTTYRKEIVILLCLTPRASAEAYHLRYTNLALVLPGTLT